MNVTNGGLSDMNTPYDIQIANPNIEIVNAKGNKFQVEPLKSRETRQVQMTLRLSEDTSHNYK